MATGFLTRLGLLAAALTGFAAGSARAERITVAVAANFLEPAQAISRAFERGAGDQVVLIPGSSGALAVQISQGAPFQVFLSADTERPRELARVGRGVAETLRVYATGRLALYSRQRGFVDGRGAVLSRANAFAKLAIADPGVAPYGSAAVETLTRLGLYAALQPRLVQGASISQTYQFVESGAAELGFVALSQISGHSRGSRWLVPDRLHRPIDQAAILLSPGVNSRAAKAFLRFLQAPQAKAIIRAYGYRAP